MTTDHALHKHGMAMCRKCGHDLMVLKNGNCQGQVRCSNKTCRWNARRYDMGKNINDGVPA